jgi:Tfp pilus assembly protein PilN
MVSAELLAGRLQTVGTINYLENNSFKKQDVIPVSLEVIDKVAQKISLEAIGVATGNSVNLPIKFDFLGQGGMDLNTDPDQLVHVVLGSLEFDMSPNMARNFAILVAIIILVPMLFVSILVPFVKNKKQAALDELNASIQKVNDEIKKLEDNQQKYNNFDVNSEIKKVLGTNRTKLMAYTALGEAVPKKLWLTYFVAKDDGKIDIKGEASNVEDIYSFYRNMKDAMIDTQLRLHKLEMKSQSVDDAVSIDPNQPSDYEFEITNMSTSELTPKTDDVQDGQQQPPQEQPEANKDDNKSSQLGKPLLNFGKDKEN